MTGACEGGMATAEPLLAHPLLWSLLPNLDPFQDDKGLSFFYTGNLAASPVCSPKELLSVHGNWPKKDFFSSPAVHVRS